MKKSILLLLTMLAFSTASFAEFSVVPPSDRTDYPPSDVSGFTPSNVSNLVLWLDANDAATISKNGSNQVSTWTDKSGLGNTVTQGTDANKPVWTDATLNGKPVLVFTKASSNYMAKTSPTSLSGMQKISIYSVIKYNNTTDVHVAFCLDDVTSGRSWAPDFGGGATLTHMYYESPVDSVYFSTTGTTAGYRLFKTTYNGATGVSTIAFGSNSASDSSMTPSSLRSQTIPFAVGVEYSSGSPDVNRYLDGGIAEIIIYTDILSSSDDSNVQNYLSNKWGSGILT